MGEAVEGLAIGPAKSLVAMRRLAGGLPNAPPGHWTASSRPLQGRTRPAETLRKLTLGRRVGQPVPDDLVGDDRAEIPVGEDGLLYFLSASGPDKATGDFWQAAGPVIAQRAAE